MADGEERGDARTHGIAHHIRLPYVQMRQQARGIIGHGGRAIGGGVIKLFRFAVAAIIQCDVLMAGSGQGSHPARVPPVHPRIGGKAVDEEYRRAVAGDFIGDPHAA